MGYSRDAIPNFIKIGLLVWFVEHWTDNRPTIIQRALFFF